MKSRQISHYVIAILSILCCVGCEKEAALLNKIDKTWTVQMIELSNSVDGKKLLLTFDDIKMSFSSCKAADNQTPQNCSLEVYHQREFIDFTYQIVYGQANSSTVSINETPFTRTNTTSHEVADLLSGLYFILELNKGVLDIEQRKNFAYKGESYTRRRITAVSN